MTSLTPRKTSRPLRNWLLALPVLGLLAFVAPSASADDHHGRDRHRDRDHERSHYEGRHHSEGRRVRHRGYHRVRHYRYRGGRRVYYYTNDPYYYYGPALQVHIGF